MEGQSIFVDKSNDDDDDKSLLQCSYREIPIRGMAKNCISLQQIGRDDDFVFVSNSCIAALYGNQKWLKHLQHSLSIYKSNSSSSSTGINNNNCDYIAYITSDAELNDTIVELINSQRIQLLSPSVCGVPRTLFSRLYKKNKNIKKNSSQHSILDKEKAIRLLHLTSTTNVSNFPTQKLFIRCPQHDDKTASAIFYPKSFMIVCYSTNCKKKRWLKHQWLSC